jgi:hypothetical protein
MTDTNAERVPLRHDVAVGLAELWRTLRRPFGSDRRAAGRWLNEGRSSDDPAVAREVLAMAARMERGARRSESRMYRRFAVLMLVVFGLVLLGELVTHADTQMLGFPVLMVIGSLVILFVNPRLWSRFRVRWAKAVAEAEAVLEGQMTEP